MLLYTRPTEPADFAEAVRAAKARIEEIIARGDAPKSEDFADVWGAYKDRFAEAQHGKCGFCDKHVLSCDDGDLEHVHPKAGLQALPHDPATWGKEKPHSASVTQREARPLCERGYYWLAYAWENYLFSCRICNRKFKRCLFPVASASRQIPPRADEHEAPLLLSCYGALRPSDHLDFLRDGNVQQYNQSAHGYETIRTCGLYREPLRGARQPITERVYYLIGILNESMIDKRWSKDTMLELLELGDERREFAGAVRTIAEHELGLSWNELPQLL